MAMLSVMEVMLAMSVAPALAALRYVAFHIVCPDRTTDIGADPHGMNMLSLGYFGDINKKLAQQYQGTWEITRYTTPSPPNIPGS
jgi:hypothetical protein